MIGHGQFALLLECLVQLLTYSTVSTVGPNQNVTYVGSVVVDNLNHDLVVLFENGMNPLAIMDLVCRDLFENEAVQLRTRHSVMSIAGTERIQGR